MRIANVCVTRRRLYKAARIIGQYLRRHWIALSLSTYIQCRV